MKFPLRFECQILLLYINISIDFAQYTYAYCKVSTFVCVLFNCYEIAARLKIFHKLETMKKMKSVYTFEKIKYFELCSKLILNKEEYVYAITRYVFRIC